VRPAGLGQGMPGRGTESTKSAVAAVSSARKMRDFNSAGLPALCRSNLFGQIISSQIALQLGSPVLNLLFSANSWNGTSRADFPGLVLIVSGWRRESLRGIPLANVEAGTPAS